MKKLFVLMMALIVPIFSLSAGPKEEMDAGNVKTMKITHAMGTTDVPMDPKKIVVLDLAAIDILDGLGLGNRIVGMPKSTKVAYLTEYFENENIAHLGDLKEVDMEALYSLQPDLIIIGGRQHANYEKFSDIAPTISSNISYTEGYITAITRNISNIASIFGKINVAMDLIEGFEARVDILAKEAEGKTAIVAIVSDSSVNTLGRESRCSIISNEIGYENLTDTNSTHGDSVSFEFLLDKNPNYLFVLDRDTAIGTDGAKLAKEVIENELVMKTEAYQNGNIVYLTPDVWYLAEGGLKSTDMMLTDLEDGIFK